MLSIFTQDHIDACISTYKKLGIPQKVHIKVNTGMNRIGVPYKEAYDFIQRVLNTEGIDLQGIFSHLACAEDSTITKMQNDHWLNAIKDLNKSNITFHMLNTAGLISYPDMQYNMVRAGIGIYGLMPDLPPECVNKPNLRQAMSLKGRIAFISDVPEGSGVSYGYSYVTNKPVTKIATIPVGYADGVSRSLSNKIYGLINGKKVKQVGNITMDQMMFDVSDIENIAVGDVITLLGEDSGKIISIDEWAKILNTINYEITCRLKVRLPRAYTR